MPAVLMNAAVPAPGVGSAGPYSPTDPMPSDDGAFAGVLAEAQGPDVDDEASPVPADAALPSPVTSASPPLAPPAIPAEDGRTTPGTPPPLTAGEPGLALAPTAPPTTATAGWPPPGLAALFPTDANPGDPLDPPLPIAAAAMPASAGGTTLRGLLAGLAGATLPTGSLETEASRPPLLPATPAAVAPAAAPTPPVPSTPIVLSTDAAMPLKLDALRAVAVPITVREAMVAATDGIALPAGPEGLDLAAWSPMAPAPLPRLDLAAAFPAPVPVHDPRLAEAMATRVQWMAGQGGGEVTLRVAPEGLGPVEIRLQLDGDRVDLGLQAAQAETRQALQDALPKLRELLSQSGLQLGHADVGQRQSSGASPNGDGRDGARSFAGEPRATHAPDDAAPPIVLRAPPRGNGLLDLYA